MNSPNFTTAKTEKKNGYVVVDKRGAEPLALPCRVCGCPVEHSKDYNKPTMDCIKWLREELAEAKELRIEKIKRVARKDV